MTPPRRPIAAAFHGAPSPAETLAGYQKHVRDSISFDELVEVCFALVSSTANLGGSQNNSAPGESGVSTSSGMCSRVSRFHAAVGASPTAGACRRCGVRRRQRADLAPRARYSEQAEGDLRDVPLTIARRGPALHRNL